MDGLDLSAYFDALERAPRSRSTGVVRNLVGQLIESDGPAAGVGDFCEIETGDGRRVRTQVVGFRNSRVLSMAFEEPGGVQAGDGIVARPGDACVAVGPGLLGRVLDGFGNPLDSGPPVEPAAWYGLFRDPPGPMEREPVAKPLVTGIRAIDSLLTCGKGQRIGIFGGSGVGKSTLLGAMSRDSFAGVSVVALVGERNREVRAFVEKDLGPEGLKKSVLVVATSDRPAPLRVRACFVALAIAEYFRDQGQDVLLVMDSATRLAMAQREIGLAAGEPPSQKGYTPSVFALLPRVFERAGNFARGSITGFFTVLVEGDDLNDPIVDAVRATLDGHIVLSRRLASMGHYPAIDVLSSVSRLGADVAGKERWEKARALREALAVYQQSEDLIQLGAYIFGTNPRLDAAIRARTELLAFLKQDESKSSIDETIRQMEALVAKLR